MFLREDWYIVRNYQEFVKRILEDGLPDMISFDHDLADIHYFDVDISEFAEKTGCDCAKWLIEYCMDHQMNLPEFYSHSMNPVGRDNMMNLLENFKNHQKILLRR
ncbi:hypothetical protein IQ37_04605 [Chryseobacterium piperi]|uniref:Cyclic-phosphate processing Receiver domain-containing protein n=1 Tax=Chryseobacterium piperi TaxID=558152 RepID=A0A086BL82_9FLAO|nr:hypothetical protein IQ37_04605 [Chryseobacterium piperi]